MTDETNENPPENENSENSENPTEQTRAGISIEVLNEKLSATNERINDLEMRLAGLEKDVVKRSDEPPADAKTEIVPVPPSTVPSEDTPKQRGIGVFF